MSNPILFFIFIIVVDLILKSVRDKKKIQEKKVNKEDSFQNKPDLNKQKPIQKPGSIRDIMSTLREEVESERQKELERRQVKIEESKKVILDTEKQQTEKRTYEDNEYWEQKRNLAKNERLQQKIEQEENTSQRDFKEDIIRGIIFSEIIAEPKSIKNQRNRM